MTFLARLALFSSFLVAHSVIAAEYIVSDGEVGMPREEVEFLTKNWAPAMQQAAANDTGERIELFNNELVNIKVAAEADKIPVDLESETYWNYVHSLRMAKQRYVVAHFLDNLDVPDMTALAEERYHTEKDKYALVKEHRLASHILFLCRPAQCNRVEKKKLANQVLAELRAGADWSEMVKEYSDDPGSKDKDGKFQKWLVMGIPQVDPHFVGGVFSIEGVGELSEVIDTKFGLHIIRLDEKVDSFYKPYEEVKDEIIASLESEYRKLALKEFNTQFIMSEAAVMDMEALDEILAPYKKQAGEPRSVGSAPDGDQAKAQPTESVTAPASAQQTMDAVKQQVEAATQQ
jgi:hypothetical protein